MITPMAWVLGTLLFLLLVFVTVGETTLMEVIFGRLKWFVGYLAAIAISLLCMAAPIAALIFIGMAFDIGPLVVILAVGGIAGFIWFLADAFKYYGNFGKDGKYIE